MKIEFPAKFEVKQMPDNWFNVTVPVDIATEVTDAIEAQDWASVRYLDVVNRINVFPHYSAYEMTPEQVEGALRIIITEVMAQRVDMSVWGDALEDE